MFRYINEKYLPKLIEIQNNHIESLGSGKVMTIFTKGMDYWSQFTEKLIGRSIAMFAILCYTAFMLTKVSFVYFAILLAISLAFNVIALAFRNV